MINFSGTENLSNLIQLEKVFLESTLDIQKNFNKQILVFTKEFMSNIDFSLDSNDATIVYMNESTSALNKSNSNIDALKNLLNLLSKLNPRSRNRSSAVKNYNISFKENMNSVYENTKLIEKFVHQVALADFSKQSKASVINESLEVQQADNVSNVEMTIPENTLIISDTQKKVIFPYEISKIEDIMKKNVEYQSVEDVVNTLYTRSINYYKFPAVSRFKEAYKLVKDKEKASRFKALSLAFELFGNYNLHPAIITACKSLDELDIYLACLEENSLDDFKFFNIKYEIPPVISKLAKNSI